ncbi:hypothetical protein Tsubulata_014945 [Turnera subulata]|uniref:WAT1-related protein n=1 Tax=Turnera subulata TaxID=218843 RepID=A0A9Q0FQB3_9ROSI|nr:hypothetical protein Tsubulata_014945 [Turnera subulata]
MGIVAQLVGFKAVEYSSPTLASAMSNLVPAFTFTLALIFRMERLAIKSCSTQAKIVGTLVSISGALVVVLYKGPVIISISSTTPSIPFIGLRAPPLRTGSWEFLFSTWYIILVCASMFLEIHSLSCFQKFHLMSWESSERKCNTIVGLDFVLQAQVMKVYPAELIGVVSSCLCLGIRTWAVRLKGPVYMAMFKPLSIAIAAFMSFIFLGDPLHLGRCGC